MMSASLYFSLLFIDWSCFICFGSQLFLEVRSFYHVLTLLVGAEGGKYLPRLTVAWQSSQTPVRQHKQISS